MNTQLQFFTHRTGSVSVTTAEQSASLDRGAYDRQVAINIARARGEFSAPVYRATAVLPPAAMPVAQADRFSHAGAAFDIVNGRAVQAVRLVGTDGYGPLVGEE